jgi:hypothetical protein
MARGPQDVVRLRVGPPRSAYRNLGVAGAGLLILFGLAPFAPSGSIVLTVSVWSGLAIALLSWGLAAAALHVARGGVFYDRPSKRVTIWRGRLPWGRREQMFPVEQVQAVFVDRLDRAGAVFFRVGVAAGEPPQEVHVAVRRTEGEARQLGDRIAAIVGVEVRVGG